MYTVNKLINELYPHMQGAKKRIFIACHSGKLKLAFTSPDVISTSTPPPPQTFWLAFWIDFTVLLVFEFLIPQHFSLLFLIVTSANPEYTGTCLRSEVQCINPTDFRVHNRILFWFFFCCCHCYYVIVLFFLLLLLFDFFSKDSEHWKF